MPVGKARLDTRRCTVLTCQNCDTCNDDYMFTCCAVHDGTCTDDAHLGQSAHWTQCKTFCENYNIGTGGGGGCPMGMLCE